MDRKHRIGIALLLAGAAAASTVGIARSVTGDQQTAPDATTTNQAIEKRQAALDRAEREIATSLAKKPPKLPAAEPAATPGPPAVVVTRRAAPAPTASTGGHEDDGDDEHQDAGGDHEGGEHAGGDDD
jgi:hypothetical protein